MTDFIWNDEAQGLFADLMRSGPPSSMVDSAGRAVRRCAERQAHDRHSATVEVGDVAAGCLRVAPPAFKPNVVARLARYGIHVELAPRDQPRPVEVRSSEVPA